MWNLYLFTEFKNGFGNNLPKYIVLFIDGISSTTDQQFKTLMGDDYSNIGFDRIVGTTKDDAWSEAIKQNIVSVSGFTLDEVCKLQEVYVSDNNTTMAVSSGPMNCIKCKYQNDYASANNADGTYTCYKCRNGI
jgi:hypothetical protein